MNKIIISLKIIIITTLCLITCNCSAEKHSAKPINANSQFENNSSFVPQQRLPSTRPKVQEPLTTIPLVLTPVAKGQKEANQSQKSDQPDPYTAGIAAISPEMEAIFKRWEAEQVKSRSAHSYSSPDSTPVTNLDHEATLKQWEADQNKAASASQNQTPVPLVSNQTNASPRNFNTTPSPLVRPFPKIQRNTGCAENGSCYGDMSQTTGLSKTTHVRGYYRKDGTYVRGHYRSRRR